MLKTFQHLLPYLILMRPANIVTAIADILAGIAVAGILMQTLNSDVYLLILSTIGLYGGGVVFNDIFDRHLDKTERPDRPIPSGKAGLTQSIILGVALLVLGVFVAAHASILSGTIAFAIALFALIYDKFGKHNPVWGPLTMGLCRSFNLMLGMSIIPEALGHFWYVAIIPLIFIADITLTSRGEVEGKNVNALRLALSLDFVVVVILVTVLCYNDLHVFQSLVFLFLWIGMNITSKIRAIRFNNSKTVMNAVKWGVLSLIPLNAAIAAGFQSWVCGLLILLLLPLSMGLAKVFAVT